LSVTANQARELVNRIEAGDGFAESELVEQFARSVKLILVKRTGSDQLANDLCQDTFVVTLKKLRAGGLKKPRSLWAFIRQTAVNISIDHYRKEKRYIHQDDGIISVLEAALEQLPVSRDRDILRRFYLADEDKAKICSDLELSRTHFDRVLYRARQRMRILIKRQKGLKSMLCGSLFET
jgi:RNA polymerase sigma-70 factor (ECF subfamily)